SYPIGPTAPADRLAHVWTLRDRCGLELAPIDIGSTSIVTWDDRARDFVGVDGLRAVGVIDNPLPFVLDALARAAELGLTPTLGAFDVGHPRTLAMLAETGRAQQPVLHKIFLSGALAVGPRPAEAALDWHLAQLADVDGRDLDVEWIAVPYAIADPVLIER